MAIRAIAREQSLGWLLGFLAASFGAAALGGLLTARSIDSWYRTLRRPAWTPPDWVFGPVWTALYAQIAVAAWLVRRAMRREPAQTGAGAAALVAWGVQIFLNVAWSAVFFGGRSVAGGLGVIAALWTAIAATAALAARVTGPAGALLLPYLAWTTFASAINFRLWQLNRRR